MCVGNRQFRCSWSECNILFKEYYEFRQHLIEHLEESWNSDSPEMLCGACNVLLHRDGTAYRHVFFHAWLVNLHLRGLSYQRIQGLPACKLSDDHSTVPDFPTPFICCWDKCLYQTNDVVDYYCHVAEHPEYSLGGRHDGDNNEFACQWMGCSFSSSRLNNLVAHLRSHTQEKIVSCPQCGLLFTARNKLRDHIIRQYQPGDPALDSEGETFQCSYCLRCFGSRNLMLAHASRHVNKHICHICKLTLQSKSALERHILYRHVNKATVPCPHCSSKFKDAYLLRAHISRRHLVNTPINLDCGFSNSTTPLGPLAAAGSLNPGGSHLFPLQTSTPGVPKVSNSSVLPGVAIGSASSSVKTTIFRCPAEGCRFYSSTQPGLLVHTTRKHPPAEPEGSYACHLCTLRFTRGFFLSRHLIRKHNYQRPSGHFRFNYVLCEDGLHRLQTLRLDTVEVASAILGPETVGEILSTGDGDSQIH